MLSTAKSPCIVPMTRVVPSGDHAAHEAGACIRARHNNPRADASQTFENKIKRIGKKK